MKTRPWFVATRLAALVGLSAALVACQSDQIVYRTQTAINTPPAKAANFVGYSDASTKQTVCGNCHVDQQAGWKMTKHASAWSDLKASGVSDLSSCIGCHTVSTKGNAASGDTAGYLGTNDPRYEDVQCENCHGAGLDHVTSPGLTNRPLASIAVDTGSKDVNGCGECHTGTHEPFVDEWRQSPHSNVEAPALSNYVSGANTTCVGCHTGQGALAAWKITTNYQERDSLTTHAVAITCAVCHDPHNNPSGDKQLRFALTTRDTSTNLCMKCHQRRSVPDLTTTSGPHSPEGPTLLGTAGWYPPSYTGPNPLVATHGSATNTNLCATCHVSRFTVTDPKTGSFQFQATGHLFNAIPCISANGQPNDGTCDISQRTFAACTGSGCHGSAAVAASAWTAANSRIVQLDSTLSKMLAKVPASEFTVTTKVTTARGAKFNLQLSESSGAVAHNPFLIETLLTSSITQVTLDYGIQPAGDVVLANILGHNRVR